MTASAERPGHPGEVRVSDEPQQAARPQGRTRRLSGVCRRGDRAARDALSGWGRPRPARRGRTGGLQGQGVRARVRLPRLDPALHERRVGEVLHLPEFPCANLPAPVEEDLPKGILESIDMDSYRVEKKSSIRIRRSAGQIRMCRKRPFATHRPGRRPARAAVCRIPFRILCVAHVEQKSMTRRTSSTMSPRIGSRGCACRVSCRRVHDTGAVARRTYERLFRRDGHLPRSVARRRLS